MAEVRILSDVVIRILLFNAYAHPEEGRQSSRWRPLCLRPSRRSHTAIISILTIALIIFSLYYPCYGKSVLYNGGGG